MYSINLSWIACSTDRQPQPPPANDFDSGSDDDYEAWDEFDDFDSPVGYYI
jgi:hypothetical protein